MKNIKKYFEVVAVVFLIGFVSCTSQPEDSNLIQEKAYNYPVLKRKSENPILRIGIQSENHEEVVTKIGISIGDTPIENLKSIRIYYTGTDSIFKDKVQYGKSIKPEAPKISQGNQVLKEGVNYFWVSYELAEKVDLNSSVVASVDFMEIDKNKLIRPEVTNKKELRIGVAVRQHWEDNVHTYRIPGLTTTNDGTLLAIYDVRRESARDLQGHMDIGVSCSTDGGNSWEPMRIALDMEEWGGLPQKFNGVSDACILVDRNSNDIYIAGLWMHGVITSKGEWVEGLTEKSRAWNHQWRDMGSQPGLGVKQTSQFLITKSTDDGKTWGEPINLTKMCKKPEWWLWAPAPGHGITLKDGTLVIPTQGRDETGLPFSNITYSKDGGNTWITSNAAYKNTTESMAVELSNGSILLNMRDNRNARNKSETNGRAMAVTTDLGKTWTEHPASHGGLIEPTCMASTHQHDYTDKDGNPKSILLFSNPNSKYRRHKQTIKVSFDDGLTWPDKYWLELDEGGGAGYSCLTSIDQNTIGILYEGSQAQMTFQSIPLSDILKTDY